MINWSSLEFPPQSYWTQQLGREYLFRTVKMKAWNETTLTTLSWLLHVGGLGGRLESELPASCTFIFWLLPFTIFLLPPSHFATQFIGGSRSVFQIAWSTNFGFLIFSAEVSEDAKCKSNNILGSCLWNILTYFNSNVIFNFFPASQFPVSLNS